MRELIKKLIPTNLFHKVEPYGHWAEAILANVVYGFPARKLKVIGVTGTDGKTTTSTLITAMLRDSGFKVGMMTTISLDLGDGPVPNPTRLTTVTSFSLQRGLKKLSKAGVDWVVLETTSHALAQHRVWGVPYSVVAMTNVTHEHLDYHGTFEYYRDAKKCLFELCNANKKGLRIGIANADDESGEIFAKAIANPVRYGIKKGDVRAVKTTTNTKGSTMLVHTPKGELNVTVNLPGSFNVYNALAAIGVGQAVGLSDAQIEQGIASLDNVEGRMTTIDEGQNFSVIVDYAHTPVSFEKIFNEIKPVTKGKMIVVFGSAGRRDEAKRPLQGKVAGEYCDVVVITEEDDRDQDGEQILNQIAEGSERAGKTRNKDLFLIHDRARAIEKAIGLAKAGDTVLLLGKGHEKSILGNFGKRDWDEAGAARNALKKLKK
jgi:UDP-N-acetylmuramoyl-L-alanyl-D-glutamate--2,6-diaminopimelate ligase